jgi:AraC family transcriptional regulator
VNIEVIERQPVSVACLRYKGPFGEPLGRFWRNTVAPWLAEHGLLDCPRYGVTIDDPVFTAQEDCRYEACVELPAGLKLPGASHTMLPGGRYAVTRFKGTGAEIGVAWGAFSAECAARGLQWDSVRPPFEHYPRGAYFDQKTGVFSCELCIPLVG